MYLDKRAARLQSWRVPERTLLLWAFAGGALGGMLAQKFSRHKTRKQPFASLLNLAIWLNILGALVFSVPNLRTALLKIVQQAMGPFP
jgi:uncharacterized membrane protein YsdA (DUF1294 family)